jgi:hypothetical protein
MMRWHLGDHGGSLGSTPEATPCRAGRYMGEERPAKAGVQESSPSKTSKVLKPTPSLQAGAGSAARSRRKSVEKGMK